MTVIEVSHLRKRYGDHVAVDDVSFTVEAGEIFGILGPNGAGKTTTVECIEGLRTPDGGTVTVLGLDPRRDRGELRQRVGAQLQESAVPEKMKVWEALDLYSSFYERPADWEELIGELGLADRRGAAFGKLSGGQKQRLSIALALLSTGRAAGAIGTVLLFPVLFFGGLWIPGRRCPSCCAGSATSRRSAPASKRCTIPRRGAGPSRSRSPSWPPTWSSSASWRPGGSAGSERAKSR